MGPFPEVLSQNRLFNKIFRCCISAFRWEKIPFPWRASALAVQGSRVLVPKLVIPDPSKILH